jgi:hypothetical protein
MVVKLDQPTVVGHGAERLSKVDVLSYNCELKDDEGFIGDRASKGAFRDFVENWRKPLRKLDQDRFGDEESSDLSKKELDRVLKEGNPEAAAIIHSAIEEFSQEFALVIRRFLRLKHWKDIERIAVGGGFSGGRIGELAMGRTSLILKAEKVNVELVGINNKPDAAGLIGSVQLVPPWMFKGHDAILAVDIGGTNIRAGIVELNHTKSSDFSKAVVRKMSLWRHGEEEKLKRDEAVDRLVKMLGELCKEAAKNDLALAPFVGIGCPGVIEDDGTIDRGAQNLPGNWESGKFNLPTILQNELGLIDGEKPVAFMHNDAVVQGLSEVPNMTDVSTWAVMTIGTGLGYACYANRSEQSK